MPFVREINTVSLHIRVGDDILDHLRCCFERLGIVRDDYEWRASPITESLQTVHERISGHVWNNGNVDGTGYTTCVETDNTTYNVHLC